MQSTVERMAYLTILLIFIGLGMAIYVLYNQIHTQSELSQQIKQAVEDLEQDKAARDKIIIDHINCIGLFLSQPNRANVKIGDLQNCRIEPIP